MNKRQGRNEIKVPDGYNYIAVFLTLQCNIDCGYCINNYGKMKRAAAGQVPGKDWVTGLNRLIINNGMPVTLQGGEPSLHRDFIWIIKNVREDIDIDILTNLTFDIDRFIGEVDPGRLHRNAPYANIRVSYHPGKTDMARLLSDALKMRAAGFRIGIYGILHPKYANDILGVQKKFTDKGLDFRTKEFLGWYEGKLYGTYLYPDALAGSCGGRHVYCRNSELILGPDGGMYKCHHDLYSGAGSISNILDGDLKIDEGFAECSQFGMCNPCDIKIKTDRYQAYGHTSVEIKKAE